MEIWSTSFLSETPTDGGLLCFVEPALWRRIHDEEEGARRIFARIQGPATTWICALGAPVNPMDGEATTREKLYLPYWMLQQIDLEGIGEVVSVRWVTEEAFPEATKIQIRPHDSAFYHVDAKAELEHLLTRIGTVQAGTTVTLPLPSLGGFEIAFDITKTEPANIVLMEGDEVAIEFEEALDGAAEAQAVPPPLPLPLSLPLPNAEPEPFEDAPMVPVAAVTGAALAAHAPGVRLGGTTHPPLSDGRPWNPWREARVKG